jgi:DNA-binding response OmpR family regulator
MPNTGRRVLVVAPHAAVADVVLGWLNSEGHEAVWVRDFDSAKPALDAEPPDLLITELKLGQFNGVHLAIRARGHSPKTSTIVIGDDDLVLERDARDQQAVYVREPELMTSSFANTARALLSQPS